MNRLTVVVTDFVENDLDRERHELARHGIALNTHQLRNEPGDVVATICDRADVIVVNMTELRDAVIERLSRCRLIIRHGIGYDNVDAAACARRGIQLANQPEYCVAEVAEHTICLLLACARDLGAASATMNASVALKQWDYGSMRPIHRLASRTLGVIGTGRIGGRVCELAQGLGFRVLGYDPMVATTNRVAGINYVGLDELVANSDFISLHAPVADATRHLVNADFLRSMKRTACLINTSRAALVDTGALAHALAEEQIAGAAIDVFDQEPPPPDATILSAPRCILTPHVAWASEESAEAIRASIVEDILRWQSGHNARHVVNGVFREN